MLNLFMADDLFSNFSVVPTLDIASLLALGAALLFLFFIMALAVYVYVALALMALAKKTHTKNPWLAWIPIANFYLVTQIAKVDGWWTLAILAPVIPFVGGLFLIGTVVWMFWRIAEKRKFPGWISLLMLIPIVNLIVLGILAWNK